MTRYVFIALALFAGARILSGLVDLAYYARHHLCHNTKGGLLSGGQYYCPACNRNYPHKLTKGKPHGRTDDQHARS